MRATSLVFVLLLALPLQAWTRSGDEKIARKAARIAPADLRLLIEQFENEYKAGLERAMAEEGADTHRYTVATRQGRLREKIVAETNATIAMIRKGEPMRDVVERLGYIAHFVADANNPFHSANQDRAFNAYQADYERYFESSIHKFPTVFYGLEQRFELQSYVDRTLSRSAGFYPLVKSEYFRESGIRTSADFDDRSTAFGIASISYSRAVTDLVNLYFHIWRSAGGDVRSARLLRNSNLLLNEQPQ